MNRLVALGCLVCCFVGVAVSGETIDVAPVWAGQPVGFALLTHKDRQFVAFYDDKRQMTVGARMLGATSGKQAEGPVWHFVRLPEKLGWDSHNYVTFAIDSRECLHLSGNMHVRPLVYYRTTTPMDIDSFEREPQMIGDREKRCTYPEFLRGPSGGLIFTYRDGSSGNGDQIYNVYDPASQAWRRLVDGPIISGEGLMNAYIQGPIRGPDGIYHMCWVWRDTGDAATNHDLSYARSRDLVHWETSSGSSLKLPITIHNAEIVDPVPVKGGLLNSNVRLAFDRPGRPVISYHKYDPAGASQFYNARLEKSDGDAAPVGGSCRPVIGPGATISAAGAPSARRCAFSRFSSRPRVWNNTTKTHITARADGSLMKQRYCPSARRLIQPRRAAGAAEDRDAAIPPVILTTQPVLMTRTAGDLGQSPDPAITYHLEWQTLPPNRDQPRSGPLPSPSMLRVIVTRR